MNFFNICVLIVKFILVGTIVGIVGFEIGLTIREILKDSREPRSEEESEQGTPHG